MIGLTLLSSALVVVGASAALRLIELDEDNELARKPLQSGQSFLVKTVILECRLHSFQSDCRFGKVTSSGHLSEPHVWESTSENYD